MLPSARTVRDAMITDVKLCGIDATVGDVRDLFLDEHVHAAVVVEDGVLRAVIDRADLGEGDDDRAPAVRVGGLGPRVVSGDVGLVEARRALVDSQRRRLAVVGDGGTFEGLLCLKRSLDDFCSEQDTRDRRS
ncbi:MAG: CBS domain-containing protein [Janthinobacterium lividum]